MHPTSRSHVLSRLIGSEQIEAVWLLLHKSWHTIAIYIILGRQKGTHLIIIVVKWRSSSFIIEDPNYCRHQRPNETASNHHSGSLYHLEHHSFYEHLSHMYTSYNPGTSSSICPARLRFPGPFMINRFRRFVPCMFICPTNNHVKIARCHWNGDFCHTNNKCKYHLPTAYPQQLLNVKL